MNNVCTHHRFDGTTENPIGICEKILMNYSNYALTYDNLIKMIGIFFRINTNIPVILMGETGCGKTSLIKYLACAADVKLYSKRRKFGLHNSATKC